MIFDVKFGGNFQRKAWLVADGNKTKIPRSTAYILSVYRDYVIICLFLAALNDLGIQPGDI